MVVKKVDPNFDGDYYDNLIFGEPLTPVPEDPVGFEQLDPIETPWAAAEQETAPAIKPETDAPTEQEQDKAALDQPTIQPTSTTADQALIIPPVLRIFFFIYFNFSFFKTVPPARV